MTIPFPVIWEEKWWSARWCPLEEIMDPGLRPWEQGGRTLWEQAAHGTGGWHYYELSVDCAPADGVWQGWMRTAMYAPHVSLDQARAKAGAGMLRWWAALQGEVAA